MLENHIPIGTRVRVLSVPYEAVKHFEMLVGYIFRVVDNEHGNYTLSDPFGYTFWHYHLEEISND
jgi:hypothetical protein